MQSTLTTQKEPGRLKKSLFAGALIASTMIIGAGNDAMAATSAECARYSNARIEYSLQSKRGDPYLKYKEMAESRHLLIKKEGKGADVKCLKQTGAEAKLKAAEIKKQPMQNVTGSNQKLLEDVVKLLGAILIVSFIVNLFKRGY